MNRILTAEVILTLTREQAQRVWWALDLARNSTRTFEDLGEVNAVAEVIEDQCEKQGVQL
jgi:hypothetical protein